MTLAERVRVPTLHRVHRVYGACPDPLWATVSAVALPVVLTSGWLIADAVQPRTFSPMRQTVSVAAGHAARDRWIMTSALLVVGACYLLAAAGLHSIGDVARAGLAVAGIAGVGIAVSPEPMTGSTMQHEIFTALGALLIAVWPLVALRRGPRAPWVQRWPVSLTVTAIFVALTVWLGWQTAGGSRLGLAERTASSIELGWPAVVAVSALLHRRRSATG